MPEWMEKQLQKLGSGKERKCGEQQQQKKLNRVMEFVKEAKRNKNEHYSFHHLQLV